MIIGTVREIWRYPVKSMGGETLETCAVTPNGIVGDRGWALRDESTRQIHGAKKWPALMRCHAAYLSGGDARHGNRALQGDSAVPHVAIQFPGGSTVNSDAADVNERLSEYLGVPVTLWPLQPASDKAHYRDAKSSTDDMRATFAIDEGEALPDFSMMPMAKLLELKK